MEIDMKEYNNWDRLQVVLFVSKMIGATISIPCACGGGGGGWGWS